MSAYEVASVGFGSFGRNAIRDFGYCWWNVPSLTLVASAYQRQLTGSESIFVSVAQLFCQKDANLAEKVLLGFDA